jgi:hypothetical protein
VTTKTSIEPKEKPRTKPAKPKPGSGARAGESTGRDAAPAKARPKPRAVSPEAVGVAHERLRPGQLDGLVVAYLRKHERSLPLGTGAIAKGIGRSSGAVGNCLERQAKADDSPVRRAKDRPRAYDLRAEATKAAP